MKEVILVLLGGIGGFAIHAISMKVSFKQRAIENKIKVYDALIATWVKMRNFIYEHHTGQPVELVPREVVNQFDQMYGSSQQFIGEAILVCEDDALTSDINALNERLYRTEWHRLNWAQANASIEQIKTDALQIAVRMREDIKSSTRFEWRDFVHILSGFFPKRRKAEPAIPADRADERRSG